MNKAYNAELGAARLEVVCFTFCKRSLQSRPCSTSPVATHTASTYACTCYPPHQPTTLATHIHYTCRYTCAHTHTCTHTHAQFRGLTCPVGAAATSTTLHTSTNQHRNVVLLDDSCTHLLLCKQTIPATPSQVWARTVYVIAWALSTQCRHPPTFTVQSAGMLMNRSSSD